MFLTLLEEFKVINEKIIYLFIFENGRILLTFHVLLKLKRIFSF